jgi:hypothetical protein
MCSIKSEFVGKKRNFSENTFTSIFRVEIQKLSANLKVGEEVSSENFISNYQITVHHIAASYNSGIHRCRKQKYQNFVRITSICFMLFTLKV